MKGECDLKSHIAEGAIGEDLTKRQSRFFCDTANITVFSDNPNHVMMQFSESQSARAPPIGFEGVMQDAETMSVSTVYLGSDTPSAVADGSCKLFFNERNLSEIACGAMVDEAGRRTVPVVAFAADLPIALALPQSPATSTPHDSTDVQDFNISSMRFGEGACNVEINNLVTDCIGRMAYSITRDNRHLLKFPGKAVAAVGFAGVPDPITGDDSIISLDRVYINGKRILAEGQCVSGTAPSGNLPTFECNAILADGRRMSASFKATTFDALEGQHLVDAVQNAQNDPQQSDCRELIRKHGYLSRAQLQCGFGKYSTATMESARTCFQQLIEEEADDNLKSGMEAFDIEEGEKGHASLCETILRDFSDVVRE